MCVCVCVCFSWGGRGGRGGGGDGAYCHQGDWTLFLRMYCHSLSFFIVVYPDGSIGLLEILSFRLGPMGVIVGG